MIEPYSEGIEAISIWSLWLRPANRDGAIAGEEDEEIRLLQGYREAECIDVKSLGTLEVGNAEGYVMDPSDLPPRTSPPSKLDLGPLEVHSPEQNRVLVTWGVWPPAPEADRPRRCEAVSGCTPFATSRLAPLLPTTCRRSLH